MPTTEERVKKIICEHLGVSEAPNHANPIDDLGADSLDVIELVMSMEEEFGIAIDDDEVEDLETVGQIVERVRAKVEA